VKRTFRSGVTKRSDNHATRLCLPRLRLGDETIAFSASLQFDILLLHCWERFLDRLPLAFDLLFQLLDVPQSSLADNSKSGMLPNASSLD